MADLSASKSGRHKFTKTGMRYVDEDDAAQEHALKRLPFNISLDEIEKRYGIGTRLYFDFLKYIIMCNVILFAIAFVNWSIFMASSDSDRTVMCNFPNMNFDYRVGCNCTTPIVCPGSFYKGVTRPLFIWEKLFISAWTSSQSLSWLVLSAVVMALWFIFGIAYGLSALLHRHVDDHDNVYDLSGDEADRIVENEEVSRTEHFVRYSVSTFIFAFLIGASAAGIYFIQRWGTQTYVKTSFWLSIVVTGIIATINLLWSFICAALVSFEKHHTWSSHRKNHMIKLYLFKIINVTVMYAALQWAFAQPHSCPLQDVGVKFFLLIILDLFVMNAVEFILPPLRTWATRHIHCLHTEGSDESELPEFDVAEEYLELLYRQFVLYIGMLTLPLLTLVSLITNLVEYPLDKFRMLKVCQRPKRLNKRLTGFIVLFMIVSALAAFLSYPMGGLWMILLVKGGLPHPGVCSIWTDKPSTLP